MQVEGHRGDSLLFLAATGGWVRNAYATYPLLGNNPEKFGLMLYMHLRAHALGWKDLSIRDWPAFH